MTRHCTPLVILIFLGLLPIAWSHADEQDEALRLRMAGKIIGLESILQSALDRYPGGRVLEAELERKPDRYEYEVELVTMAGDVRELEFDAHSGRLLSDEEDD